MKEREKERRREGEGGRSEGEGQLCAGLPRVSTRTAARGRLAQRSPPSPGLVGSS